MHRPPLRLLSLLSLVAPAFLACGDDGPTEAEPLPPRTVVFPAEAASLQDAVNRVAVGGTIVVTPGTHEVSTPVVIPSLKAGLTITSRTEETGTGRGDATRPLLDVGLDAANESVFTIEAEDVTIEGLLLEGTYLDGVVITADGATVTDCMIVGPLRDAISCTGSNEPDITRNFLVAAGRYGVRSGNGSDPRVVRNTIVDADDCALYAASGTPVYTANILTGSARWGVYCEEIASPVLSCNVLFDNATADYSAGCEPGADDRHADPLFCDRVTYGLASDSPCVDTASECGFVGASEDVCDLVSRVSFPSGAATLQDAVNMLIPGGTLTIEAGTHLVRSTTSIPPSKAGLSITAATGRRGGERPVLDLALNPTRDDGVNVGAADVTISGIRITGTYRHGIVIGSNGVITDCWIENADDNAIQCQGENATPTIRGNYLVASGRFGVSCTASSAPWVERNTIVDSGDCGIYASGADPFCRANVITGSVKWGIACFVGAEPTLSCNVLFENTKADYSPFCEPGESDLPDTDPGFCETETYTLLPSSPCIAGAGGCGWIGASELVCAP